MKQSKGRDNVQEWIHSLNQPPNYMPKVDAPPLGYFEDFCAFVSATWRPVFFGFLCAISLVAWFLLG